MAVRGPRGQLLAMAMAASPHHPRDHAAHRRRPPHTLGGRPRLRPRRRRVRLRPRVGGRGAPARRLPGPRPRRPGPDRGPARVRGRLRVHVEGRQGPPRVRTARPRQHDRRQPAADRHRVVARRPARRVADAPDRQGRRLHRAHRRRREARSFALGGDRVPRRRHALLADPAAQADDRTVRRRRADRPLRRVHGACRTGTGRGAAPRGTGPAHRHAADRGCAGSWSDRCSSSPPA